MPTLKSLRNAVGRWLPGGETPLQRYLALNRRHWAQDWPVREQAVVLTGLFDWKPVVHCYSYAANHLARRHGARIAAFDFGRHMPPEIEEVFASFGAPLELGWKQAAPFQARAEAAAAEIFAGLRSKRDVVEIRVEGMLLGDLIYDTYLRFLSASTVELQDSRLRDFIRDALLIFFTARDFFARHQVVAVLADHTVYIGCGVLARLAAQQGVPLYHVYYTPSFFLERLECGVPGMPIRWPWWRYRELFAELPAAEQEAARERGRASLTARLSGQVQSAVLRSHSAYGAGAGARLLSTSDKPKILVMLHDFCDAVHVFRDLLFVDFVDWIYFLLSRAAQTPFEWYVKPHPNLRDPARAAMNATNDAMVAQLQRDFPRVQFLPPGASNRQLVDEGIDALFTVYGTAGHELAYLGVPVVNAGDNPHIAYTFNYHPKSLDEYAALIARAGSLPPPAAPGEIEEYHYMNYFYFPEQHASGATLVDPAVANSEAGNRPEIYDRFIADATPENEARVTAWFDRRGQSDQT